MTYLAVSVIAKVRQQQMARGEFVKWMVRPNKTRKVVSAKVVSSSSIASVRGLLRTLYKSNWAT
jgi:hypothetical protein